MLTKPNASKSIAVEILEGVRYVTTRERLEELRDQLWARRKERRKRRRGNKRQ